MKSAFLLGICLVSTGLQASDCEFEKNIDQTLDLSGSEQLTVLAAAGELGITGVKDSSSASIRGRVCVSEKEWLEQTQVRTRDGKQAEIVVDLPDFDGWGEYAYLDLELIVPESISLDVKDSSGDIEIERVGELTLQDSSGDIKITGSSGSLGIRDSSGDIVISDVEGSVTIESDSSGDIRGKAIEKNVLVKNDSSGDIRFNDVGQDFVVERDSSGDIYVDKVGGDFNVIRDGSGEISATNVAGDVRVPDKKS